MLIENWNQKPEYQELLQKSLIDYKKINKKREYAKRKNKRV